MDTFIGLLVAFWPLWAAFTVLFVVCYHDRPRFVHCPRCWQRASVDQEGYYCGDCEIDIREA